MAVKNKNLLVYKDYLSMAMKKLNKKQLSTNVKDLGQYDLIVIGGGSGGVACALEARNLGARVALLDYVSPSPQGTHWGLGGTCVNVGCIPKKLMHHAALLGDALKDAEHYGWTKSQNCTSANDWEQLTTAVNNHIKSVNWLTRVSLRKLSVDYINAKGSFTGPHTVNAVAEDQSIVTVKGKNIVIAVGGRPKYLDIPGSELAITSDDIFSLAKPPKKTLIVGAGYVAMECAGFLKGLNFPVTVMIRNTVLRGFDQQMVEMVAQHMEESGVRFLRKCMPKYLTKISSGQIRVKYQLNDNGEEEEEDFDTVLFAVGRTPTTEALSLGTIGVKVDATTKKVLAKNEQSDVKHIFAVGDCLHGVPELTPVAIQAGKLLAKRLFGKSEIEMDYTNVATTIFTPLEYGCVGLSEEDCIAKYGEDNVEIYHSYYKPTEYMLPQRSFDQCYLKVICKRKERLILGMHFLGPTAGEVIQGYAVAMKCGVTMEQLNATVGIHPTVSEEFTRLFITKRSGLDPSAQICCS